MKAILVGISTNYDRYDLDYSLDELKNLAEALDIEVCDKVTQKLEKPNTKTYVGKGKLTEINFAVLAHDADIVIFDYERINDTPSYAKPVQMCDGIEYVIVDGQIVYHDKKTTGVYPGKVF